MFRVKVSFRVLGFWYQHVQLVVTNDMKDISLNVINAFGIKTVENTIYAHIHTTLEHEAKQCA